MASRQERDVEERDYAPERWSTRCVGSGVPGSGPLGDPGRFVDGARGRGCVVRGFGSRQTRNAVDCACPKHNDPDLQQMHDLKFVVGR